VCSIQTKLPTIVGWKLGSSCLSRPSFAMHGQGSVEALFLGREKSRAVPSGDNTCSTASCSRPSNSGLHGLSPSPPSVFPMRKTQKKWTDVHEKYKTTAIIGQGTYGIVYKGERRSGPCEDVALKRARLDAFTDFGIPETALREVTILRDLKHENIMHVSEISCSTSRMYMVCEYLEMDLKKFIRSHVRAIPRQVVKQITYEILKGLAFCHGHRVMHRDLKPHNILLSKDASKVKLADFGLARPKLAPSKTITHDVVTLWYRAPELLLGECKYCDSIDMWSVGCIVAEMLSGKALFPGDSEIDTLLKIFRMFGTPTEAEWPEGAMDPLSQFPVFARKVNPFAAYIPNLEPEVADLLENLLMYDASSRITALDALEHPWFNDIRPKPLMHVDHKHRSLCSVSSVSSPSPNSSNSMKKYVVTNMHPSSAIITSAHQVTHGDSITTAASSTVHRNLSNAISSSTNASSPLCKPIDDTCRMQHQSTTVGAKNTWLPGGGIGASAMPMRSLVCPQRGWHGSYDGREADSVVETKQRAGAGWWKWSRKPRSKTCTAVDKMAAAVTALVLTDGSGRDSVVVVKDNSSRQSLLCNDASGEPSEDVSRVRNLPLNDRMRDPRHCDFGSTSTLMSPRRIQNGLDGMSHGWLTTEDTYGNQICENTLTSSFCVTNGGEGYDGREGSSLVGVAKRKSLFGSRDEGQKAERVMEDKNHWQRRPLNRTEQCCRFPGDGVVTAGGRDAIAQPLRQTVGVSWSRATALTSVSGDRRRDMVLAAKRRRSSDGNTTKSSNDRDVPMSEQRADEARSLIMFDPSSSNQLSDTRRKIFGRCNILRCLVGDRLGNSSSSGWPSNDVCKMSSSSSIIHSCSSESACSSVDCVGDCCVGDDCVGDDCVGDDCVGDDCVGDDCVGDDCVGDDCVGDDCVGDCCVGDDCVGEEAAALLAVAPSAVRQGVSPASAFYAGGHSPCV